MKQVLVTGGLGFIGSNFVRSLLADPAQYSVINLDKLTYAGNPKNLEDINSDKRYRFIHGDVCDLNLLRRIVQNVDLVVHFASETHVDRSIDDSQVFLRTNVLGTHSLLEALRESGRLERFIHFSTDEVYGSITSGEFSETHSFEPTSPYSASKAAADLLVQAYIKTYRFPAVIIRGCNHFGPYQFPEKVIPLFITNLIDGKKIPLYSQGENSREWLYVADSCRAVLHLLKKGVVGEIYNLGSGVEIKNIDLAKMILKKLNKDESFINFVRDRPAHDLRYKLDSRKLRLTGFQCANTFEQSLDETISWYRNHQEWWKPLKKDQYTVK